MTKIVSRPYNYAPDSYQPEGPKPGNRGRWYYDKETRQMTRTPPSEAFERRPSTGISIRTDEMKPTECMANGKVYTSKRKYHDAIEAHGYELTEGERVTSPRNETKENERHEADMAADIEKAYHQVKNGDAPLTELDKELCKIQNRTVKNKV